MFEHFPHTADLGLRVIAPDLPTLFAEAARGLSAMVVPDLNSIHPQERRALRIVGQQLDYLLFDWLNELLYLLDAEGFVGVDFTVKVSADGLEAQAAGERLDRQRHRLEHEVKAITYHGLKVERVAEGFLAEVIVDI